MDHDILSTTRIESIDLSGNLLTSLPLALAALNTLRFHKMCILILRMIVLTITIFRRVDMSDNQLTSVSPEILANLTRCLTLFSLTFTFFSLSLVIKGDPHQPLKHFLISSTDHESKSSLFIILISDSPTSLLVATFCIRSNLQEKISSN